VSKERINLQKKSDYEALRNYEYNSIGWLRVVGVYVAIVSSVGEAMLRWGKCEFYLSG
jgi:hypothetical protein